MPKLLASAATVEGIQAQIRRFWVSDQYTVDSQTLEITHPTKDVASMGVRVVEVRGRYRFERVT